MPCDKLYFEYTGLKIKNVLEFLEYLENKKIKTWIRQVVIEGVNDTDENIEFLNGIFKLFVKYLFADILMTGIIHVDFFVKNF